MYMTRKEKPRGDYRNFRLTGAGDEAYQTSQLNSVDSSERFLGLPLS